MREMNRFLGRVVEEVGEDLFIYSSDYPHADRTEGTAQYLKQRDDIPEAVRKKAPRRQCPPVLQSLIRRITLIRVLENSL